MTMKNPPHPGLSVPLIILSTARAGFQPIWRFVSTRLSAAARKSGCGFKWHTTSRKPANMKALSAGHYGQRVGCPARLNWLAGFRFPVRRSRGPYNP